RLPLGGERFAGMDARRRAPSLLARVLSGLGRCVRGGTAADVRARPGREDQESLEGTEGAGGAARGAGVPAGIARPRRAVVGPRSDRPPRHPRRRHPHHCRRRAHGALLVASARRGGAGRRSRDDDQPRHDRAERAAADAQGVARRHDARRDFRRPRRDGLIMRSPAAAIAWEFRRRHRWGLLALLAYLAALAAVRIFVGRRPIDFDNDQTFALVVIVPLTATFIYFLAVFSFGLSGDLAARQS